MDEGDSHSAFAHSTGFQFRWRSVGVALNLANKSFSGSNEFCSFLAAVHLGECEGLMDLEHVFDALIVGLQIERC